MQQRLPLSARRRRHQPGAQPYRRLRRRPTSSDTRHPAARGRAPLTMRIEGPSGIQGFDVLRGAIEIGLNGDPDPRALRPGAHVELEGRRHVRRSPPCRPRGSCRADRSARAGGRCCARTALESRSRPSWRRLDRDAARRGRGGDAIDEIEIVLGNLFELLRPGQVLAERVKMVVCRCPSARRRRRARPRPLAGHEPRHRLLTIPRFGHVVAERRGVGQSLPATAFLITLIDGEPVPRRFVAPAAPTLVRPLG